MKLKKMFASIICIAMILSTMVPVAFADGEVAEVNGVAYTTLQAAIDAASEGQTVKLLTDVTESEIVIGEKSNGKNINLDLDGHKITCNEVPTEENTYVFAISVNSSVVSIKNGTIETFSGVGGIEATYPGCVVTLDNLTVACKGESDYNKEWNSSAVSTAAKAEIVINSGNYSSERSAAIILKNTGGNVTVNGGTFSTGHLGDISGAARIDGTWSGDPITHLTINDGVFEGYWAFRSTGPVNDVVINGGTFNGMIDSQYGVIAINGGTFNGNAVQAGGHQNKYAISGGTFIDDVSKYTTEDVYAVKDENGIYVIKSYVADVDGQKYKTLTEAIDVADENDTVTVIGDASDEAISISKSITIISDEANKATLNNVAITMNKNGIDVTVSNLKFTGISYINAHMGASLTVTGVEADVTPTKVVNGRAAFIVTGGNEDSVNGLKLVVTENVIVSSEGNNPNGDTYTTAIFGWRYLADGTTITGNTFGSEEKPLYFVAVKLMNAMHGSTFTVANNTVYGSNEKFNFKAFDFYQNCSRDNEYTVISNNNVINVDVVPNDYYYCAFYLEGSGGTNLIMLDNGTTINGEAVTMDDININGLPANYDKFYGINVTLDSEGKVNGGILSAIPADKYIADGFEIEVSVSGDIHVIESVLLVDEIEVKFALVYEAEGEKLYNINLTAGESTINRLNSADLTFILTQFDGANEFEIIASNEEVAINPVNNSDVRYEFHYKNKDVNVSSDTNATITIGQVKFTGYGKFNFAVDTSATTNAAHATTLFDNIVDTFVPNGDIAAGEGELDITNSIITGAEIAVPKRDLTINVSFPNAIEANSKDYQNMKITVTGPESYKKVIYLSDGKDGENLQTASNGVVYYAETISGELTLNTPYTVTVEGAGYRTAKYTVSMTEDKNLYFWNNVMDNAQPVEISASGVEKHEQTVNFLAGDIVKDNNINVYDLSAVVSYFGEIDLDADNKPEYAKYDLNRDGKIDSKDVAYVLVSWGN